MTIIKEIIDHFADYPVFIHRDVKLYLNGKKKKIGDLSRLISYMKSKHMIHAVRNGVYTLNKDEMVAGFAYSPFYYGLLSALTIRELWTQNSRPEILTIKKVRKSGVYIFGDKKATIFVHHIPARCFFGFDIIKYGKLKIPVSDPEKTLIDLFYYKIKLPIQDYSGLLRIIDKRKMVRYLKVYKKPVTTAILNFVKRYKPLADSGKLESSY